MALSSIMCQNFVTFCGTQDLIKETCGSMNEDELKDFPSLQIWCIQTFFYVCYLSIEKLQCNRKYYFEQHASKGEKPGPLGNEVALRTCGVPSNRTEALFDLERGLFLLALIHGSGEALALVSERAESRTPAVIAEVRIPPRLSRSPTTSRIRYSALEICISVSHSCQHFERMIRSGQDKTCVCLSRELLRLDTFNQVDRRNIVNKLERLLQMQSTLESVCLEGLSLSGDEGVRLLLALHGSRKTMKYLYCWRAFARTKASQMLEPDTDCESGCYQTNEWKKCDLLRAIASFESLTTLSVNYAYIATPTGDLLVNLSKALGAKWQWLLLLCTEDDIDGKHFKCSEYCTSLPATTWSTMKHFSPELKVQYSIVNVPEYDRHKRFFAKTTPVHTFALSTPTSEKSRQRYFTDCTMKILYAWYADTLVYLHLHFWHQRDDMDSHLEKLFLRLPALRVFEFTGEVRRLEPLCAMCCQIRAGQCNVYSVNMQLQKVIHADIDNEKLVKSIHRMLKTFRDDFSKLMTKFLVSYVDD